jgi:hypothetical protein
VTYSYEHFEKLGVPYQAENFLDILTLETTKQRNVLKEESIVNKLTI